MEKNFKWGNSNKTHSRHTCCALDRVRPAPAVKPNRTSFVTLILYTVTVHTHVRKEFFNRAAYNS